MADTPSAWKIEKALAAWNEARTQHLDAISSGNEDFWLKTNDLMDVVRKLAIWANIDERSALMCKETMADTAIRKKRFEAREAKKREIILQLMDILGMKSEDFGDVSVSVSPGVSSVVITNLAALPEEYTRDEWVRTPKKREIKYDLEQGVVIEGACLSNAVPFITIRTK